MANVENVTRVLLDVNGTLIAPKPGEVAHFTSKAITDDFLRSTAAIAHYQPSPAFFEDNMSLALGVSSRFVVTNVDLKGGTAVDCDEYFDRYERLTQASIDGCRKMKEELGLCLTINSAIPFRGCIRLAEEMEKILSFLDPDLLMIMAPDEEIGGSQLKSAINIIRCVYEDLYSIDDDQYINEILDAIHNGTVFSPIPKSDAFWQPHLNHLPLPNTPKKGERPILFDHNVGKAADYLAQLYQATPLM